MSTEEEPVVTDSTEDVDDFSKSGDLTGDGGVIKEILQHGVQGWQKPENGDDVQMHYSGTLLDGTKFDSSYDRGTPFSFKLGDGKVIKGWDIVGKTMAKGEKARVTLKPEYAYGSAGSPPKIPENATLVFEMELLSWTSKRDVFGDGSVIKTEISPGTGWERPGSLAEATLSVTATQMNDNGTEQLSKLHQEEVIFTFGSKQVPDAWEKVVQDMKKDTEVSLICRAPHLTGPSVTYVPEDAKCVKFDLKLMSWRKIEDIHSDGKLVKKVLQEGDGWERPNEGSTVVVTAKFMLPDTTHTLLVPPPVAETAVAVGDLEFKVGDGIVIDGLDRVVQSMKVNESAVVAVSPEHAFASAPGLLTKELTAQGFLVESKILLEVKLNKFEKAKDVWSMSFEEKVEEMKLRKERGNELFKAKRYATAKKSYDRAVAFFDSPTSELSPELKAKVNELLVKCHLNLAVCLRKMGDIQQVMVHCKKALEIQPANDKALFHQGCAYLELDDYDNAKLSLKYALELSPNNVDIRKKLKELKDKRTKQDAQDRKLYSNLFGRMRKLEEKEGQDSHSNGIAEPVETTPGKEVADAEMVDAQSAPVNAQ